MRQSKRRLSFLALALLVVFTGCMRQYPQADGEYLQGGGGLGGAGLNSSVFSGQGSSAGGSGSLGSLTQADTSALQNVVGAANAVSVKNDANAQALGIDSAISQELIREINQIRAQEREGQNMTEAKWLMVGKIIESCSAKASALFPKPGEPLIGDWSGRGACGIGNFAINGPGNKQVYTGKIGGADLSVAAYNDGRFEARSSFASGSGTDNSLPGEKSGSGVLTRQIARATKYGTQYDPCQAKIELVNARSPIPENYKTAMKVMGGCYRNAMALMGMESVLNKMNPQLAQALFQQMLK